MQLGDDHPIVPCIQVGRQTETGDRFLVLSRGTKNLERVVGPVAHDRFRVCRVATIDPDAMWGGKGTFTFARTTKLAKPVSIPIVVVDEVRPIAVGQQKFALVQKGEICGHEPVAAPLLFRILRLAWGVNLCLHGGAGHAAPWEP